MGSFNTICALSGLQITPGTKIKILFATLSPYAFKSDDSFFNFNKSFFARTLPISAVYDDYGNFEIEDTKENSLIKKSIVHLFKKDAIKVPYGYNQYHSSALTKDMTFESIVAASLNGRLRIKDDGYAKDVIKHYVEIYDVKKPESDINFPTWRKVSKIMSDNGFDLMMDKDNGTFNVQKVTNPIVSVDFLLYENVLENLQNVQKVLEPIYDCKIFYKKNKYFNEIQESEPILMVYPKGYNDNPSILYKVNDFYYQKNANIHPEHLKGVKKRKLPVVFLNIREDVWNVYKNVKIESYYNNSSYNVDSIKNSILEVANGIVDNSLKYYKHSLERVVRNYLNLIPFQTQPLNHYEIIVEHLKKNNRSSELEGITNTFAEIIKIEIVMSHLLKTWNTNFYGHQEKYLKEWKSVNSGLLDILNEEILQEKINELKDAFDDDDDDENVDNSHVKEIFELENWYDNLNI